jgi:hypothetical protein
MSMPFGTPFGEASGDTKLQEQKVLHLNTLGNPYMPNLSPGFHKAHIT